MGFVIADLEATTIDLLSDSIDVVQPVPMAALIRISRQRFREQLARERLSLSMVGSASLDIARSTVAIQGYVNGHVRPGFEVTWTARAESDLHTTYTRTTSIFVAPHDAAIESRGRRSA